jgi:hypothetical protein
MVNGSYNNKNTSYEITTRKNFRSQLIDEIYRHFPNSYIYGEPVLNQIRNKEFKRLNCLISRNKMNNLDQKIAKLAQRWNIKVCKDLPNNIIVEYNNDIIFVIFTCTINKMYDLLMCNCLKMDRFLHITKLFNDLNINKIFTDIINKEIYIFKGRESISPKNSKINKIKLLRESVELIRDGWIMKDEIIEGLDFRLYQDNDDDICSICLEKIKNGQEIIELPCGHIFNAHCIINNMMSETTRSKQCPNCRTTFINNQLQSD